MFVVGVLKYGERTWALKHGNLSSIRSSVQTRDDCPGLDEILRDEGVDDEEILLQAHFHFYLCKSVFTDAGVFQESEFQFPELHKNELVDTDHKSENIKKWVEMELSLMYDILHTKAAVIHTWYGLCIHLISLLGTATALLLFQLSLSNAGTGDHGYHHPYSRVDVIISYALLVGALLLEAISLCRAVLSSWTSQLLLCRRGESGWKRRLGVLITSLRRRVRPSRWRRWAGSIGQYNLLHLATRDKEELWTRLATKMGLQDAWNKLHFSGTFSPTDGSLSMQDLENLVLSKLWHNSRSNYQGDFMTRGNFSLQQANLYEKLPVAKWCITGIDFSTSILVWHIATDVYIHESSCGQQQNQIKLVQATQVLSNYMMFLLVAKPDLLPSPTRRDEYHRTLKVWDFHWSTNNIPMPSSQGNVKPYCKLIKNLFHCEGPSPSTISRREKLAKKLFDTFSEDYPFLPDAPLEINGINLAKELLHIELQPEFGMRATLEVIFSVWVELMSYAAEHCRRDSHARELSNGGEFITIVWLLLRQLKGSLDGYRFYSV